MWRYSGVRPLYDDGASAAKDATRDYVLKLDGERGPALLNVFGGKITTYRRLAEDVLDKLAGAAPGGAPRRLDGAGEPARRRFPCRRRRGARRRMARRNGFLTAREARRYVRHYGTLTRRFWAQPAARGSRPRFRRRFDGSGSRLSDGQRICAKRGGRRLAAHEIGPADARRRNRGARPMDGGGSGRRAAATV